ncbi:J domain-containing protein [Desertibaculum subflavum]|uniref:J domain-containing protein n=1 Tax=Desertibaculum subflavum TaxID=2268458 RepID=UPI000E663B24
MRGAAESEAPGRGCDHPDCSAAGQYRAPKDRRGQDHFWFCLDHVRAYNAGWDFFSGMNQSEIEAYQRGNSTWHRPTWRLGDRPGTVKFAGYEWVDPMDIIGAAGFAGSRAREERPEEPRIDPEARQAFADLDLEPSSSLQEIKTRYKQLVKRFHPDANGGDTAAEEQLKRIIRAYSVLTSRGGG